MAQLSDLVTILYRPRETMRRVLDSPERWATQVVALAFVCASVNDSEVEAALTGLLPDLGMTAGVALVLLGLILGAVLWVIELYVLSWIAWFAGRKLGGNAPAADVRAALAWAMVPVIWSIIYRVPLGILARRLHLPPNVSVSALFIQFASHGGCSMVALYFALQLAIFVWCLCVATLTIAETQRFATSTAFANVAITLAVPAVIIAAAIAARHG